MSTGVIALVVLFVVIAIGFWKKMNVGILAIAAAVILGYATNVKASTIISGFSASLFMTLLGVTFLFGIVQSNGSLELLVKKIVALFDKKVWVSPILIFIVGWIISAIGPGCVPALAFVAAIAIPMAHATGYNPIMLMMIGDVATYSGRFTAITPEGVLVTRLLAEQGITISLTALVLNTLIGAVILSIIFFVFYKGYKIKGGQKVETGEIVAAGKFNSKQLMALAGIVVMIVLVVFVKMDVGLASFLIAVVLALLGVGKEKEALKAVPWGTLVMVCGVGVLMKLVIGSGGIKLLAETMSSIMSPSTAPALAGATAGIMSWFSSTMGVVLPTLLPTIGTIVKEVGGNVSVIEIVSTIGIISSCAGFSPASTVGAIILASTEADPVFKTKFDTNKLFVTLFAWSVFCVVFLALLSLTGIFGIIT